MPRVVLGDGDGGGSTASMRTGVCDSAGGDAPATTSSGGSSNAGESVVGQMYARNTSVPHSLPQVRSEPTKCDLSRKMLSRLVTPLLRPPFFRAVPAAGLRLELPQRTGSQQQHWLLGVSLQRSMRRCSLWPWNHV